MSTICGGIATIHLLLALLRLELLLLSELPLLLIGLLPLNGREEVVSLEVLGVIMADTLLLHLLEFLQQGQRRP